MPHGSYKLNMTWLLALPTLKYGFPHLKRCQDCDLSVYVFLLQMSVMVLKLLCTFSTMGDLEWLQLCLGP